MEHVVDFNSQKQEGFGENFKNQHWRTLEDLEHYFGDPEQLSTVIDYQTLEEQTKGDPLLEKLLQDMKNYCERYTESVALYNEFLQRGFDRRDEGSEKENLDTTSRIIHNATIDSINILARALKNAGKDTSWIEKLGKSRAAYGYLAIALTYKEVLKDLEKGVER